MSINYLLIYKIFVEGLKQQLYEMNLLLYVHIYIVFHYTKGLYIEYYISNQ